MILFHVDRVDLDDPEVRSRAWLPACLLRRSGLAARVVADEIPAALLQAATCVILTGSPSRHALDTAQRAADAKVPVILDVGSVDRFNALVAEGQRDRFLKVAALCGSVVAGTEALARQIEQVAGIRSAMVAPDPVDLQDGLATALSRHPGATMRALAKWTDGWVRDAVARLRGRWPGEAESGPATRRILWFGASRRPNAEGGIGELLLAASDLADLAEEFPLRLDIVGRSPRTTRRWLKHLGVPITFHRYSPRRVWKQLSKADLCLLPGGGDRDSLARSSARARLASALGVPAVAATADTSLLPAMRAALLAGARQDRSAVRADCAQEARIIGTAWRQSVDAPRRSPASDIAIRVEKRLQVLLLLQQFQDIDLIVPIAEAASADPSMAVRVAILSKIAVPASRRLRTVCARGGKLEFWHGGELLSGRMDAASFAADVAVTASEGPGFGARFAKAFAEASRAAGVRVLSLQHGLDNGGLTYGPKVSPKTFAGDLVLTWGGLQRLTHAACPEIRARTIPVGCPKRIFRRGDFPEFPLADRPFIAVFENLHWRRYDDDYRVQFVSDLAAAAESLPDQSFLVKPHMGGRWFTRGAGTKGLPANVTLADPDSAQWRRFTADAFLTNASAVITTPSTIAFDAARYGVPVAVVTYGIDAQNYHPLPRLEQTGHWLAFVDEVRRGIYDSKKREAFFAEAALPGDAVTRILTVVRMAAARRPYGEILSAVDEPLAGLAVT